MKTLVMLSAAFMLVFLVSHADAASKEHPVVPAQSLPSAAVMFVIQGKGSLILNEKSQYTLIVKNSKPMVTWLTKKPLTQAGYTPLMEFIGLWEKQKPFLKMFYPRAVLIMGDNVPLVIEIKALEKLDDKITLIIRNVDENDSVLKPEKGDFLLVIDGINP